MRVSDLSSRELRGALAREGIDLVTGPFVVRVRSRLFRIAKGIHVLYAAHQLGEHAGFVDFHVEIEPGGWLRRLLRPQARFSADGKTPFAPLPIAQAFALFEWALNWHIASWINDCLIVHAAVVEKGGRAVIMPAPPGSGKSTLCAALVSRGWRLLSDELALIDLSDHSLIAIPRPVNLKNESIDVIARFAPDAPIAETVHNTTKGTVAYLKPPEDSVARSSERAQPNWIIFPRFVRESDARIEARPRGQAFMQIAENSVNYSVLGLRGFETLAEVVDCCECFELRFGELEEAIAAIEEHSAKSIAHSTDEAVRG